MRLFITLFFTAFLHTIYAQQNLSKEQALEDITTFLEKSYDIHPQLFAKVDSLSFSKAIQDMPIQADAIAQQDFHLHLSKHINLIADGHTFVSFSNFEYYDEIKNASITAEIKVEAGEIYLLKEGGAQSVSAINGLTTPSVLASLLPLVNGELMAYKERVLSDRFAYFYQLYYGQTPALSFQYDQQNDTYPIQNEDKEQAPYAFFALSDSVYVLELNTFSFNTQEAKDFKRFIENCFTTLEEQKIRTLLIDVSENQGGNSSYGDYVLDYLSASPYTTYAFQQLKRSKTSKKYFKKKFLKWYLYPIAIFNKNARLVIFKKEGIQELETAERSPEQQQHFYTGQTILTTSAKTYSAGASFTVSFKNAAIGKVVGEAIGQPCSGFLDLISYQLPHSKIVVATSFKTYQYANCSTQTNEVLPDITLKRVFGESSKAYYNRILERLSNG